MGEKGGGVVYFGAYFSGGERCLYDMVGQAGRPREILRREVGELEVAAVNGGSLGNPLQETPQRAVAGLRVGVR